RTPASTAVSGGVSGARDTSIARQANGTFAEKGINDETLEDRAVEVTTRNVGDLARLSNCTTELCRQYVVMRL
ncbi:hypothetical protein, partial [Salipiger aestuarii]|uniref:hypothetical protein n=1 Tax=Salipiger aestuarii TaxID=568098 RepID=UPI001CC316AF